jgi:hypothetical protein
MRRAPGVASDRRSPQSSDRQHEEVPDVGHPEVAAQERPPTERPGEPLVVRAHARDRVLASRRVAAGMEARVDQRPQMGEQDLVGTHTRRRVARGAGGPPVAFA